MKWFLLIVIIATSCAVATAMPRPHAEEPSGAQLRTIDLVSFIDANDILMFVDNQGGFGRDLSDHFGYGYGTFYPFLSVDSILNGSMIKSPLFAGGIWLGGKVAGQTRVAISEFSSEFWPGPISGGAHIPDADTMHTYRVYRLYADSMAANPNADYLAWPAEQGAPVDGSGHPLLSGDQTLWSVYNDANPDCHHATAGSSDPLGIEIQQTTWASDSPGEQRIIYIEYRLFNKGANTVSDFYVSTFLDPDLGGFEDDLVGCDSLDNLMFCYNDTGTDQAYGVTAPAIGVKVIAGPIEPSPGDTACFFRTRLPGFRNLPLRSFVGYPNGDDPQSAAESYNLQMGFRRDGSPLANGTRFSYPGDPVTGTGDLDTYAGNPHFVGSCGPLTFAPGDSQYVLIALGIGQGTDRLSSITDLRNLLNSVDAPTGSPEDHRSVVPRSFQLAQNFPNPFNPGTTIEYTLRARSHVSVDIFDLLGRKVATLVDRVEPAGKYRVAWNGTDFRQTELATGVYFCRMRVGEWMETRKMVLLK